MHNASTTSDALAQPKPRRVGLVAWFFLFCAVYFAIVSLLTFTVLREVSAGYTDPSPGYLSRNHPMLWAAAWHSWQVLSAPTTAFDGLAQWMDMPTYRWNEAHRVLAQCAFCGVVWGLVTVWSYLVARWIVAPMEQASREPQPGLPSTTQ